MKSKSSTLAQRFGFADPDLTTPAHDALLMWLDANIESIAQKRLGNLRRQVYDRRWDFNHQRHIERTLTDSEVSQVEPSLFGDWPLGDTTWIVKKTWECPVMDKSYTIGFCDMMVDLQRSCSNGYVECIEGRVQKVYSGRDERQWWLEIKPSIPSVGELMRQLRMYQSYTRDGAWFVVSPDTRWRSQIEAQGFGFIEAEP